MTAKSRPNVCSHLVAAFALDDRIGIVFGNTLAGPYDPAAGVIPSYIRQAPFMAMSMRHKDQVEGLSACMGLRRTAWDSLGGFDEGLGAGGTLKSGAETDFAIRALLAQYYIYETPEIAVTHHGFRTWSEGQQLVRSYWYGTGAVFAKHVKLGHGAVVVHMLYLVRRWLTGGKSQVAQSLAVSASSRLRLVSFLRGFTAGLRTPLNSTTGNFRASEIPGER